MTLIIVGRTAVIIVGPPAAPTANQGVPSFRKTIVGVIADNGRFSGWTALRSPCIKRNIFGPPGFAAKSSISSFKRKPAPVTVAAEPKPLLIVYVFETTLPSALPGGKCALPCGS